MDILCWILDWYSHKRFQESERTEDMQIDRVNQTVFTYFDIPVPDNEVPLSRASRHSFDERPRVRRKRR